MALRDKPYLPLYVQDFLTDEKLRECKSSSVGVYSFLMCVMHKSIEYGVILLKQKDKQTDNQITNFALKLLKHLPYGLNEIESALIDLCDEKVLKINGDRLIQKRMVNDDKLSETRAATGSKGGKKTQNKNRNFALANNEANTDIDNDIDNDIVIGKRKKILKRKTKVFIPPKLFDVESYFMENGFSKELAFRFFNSYSVADWHDSNDKPVRNWKQKAINVWFKDENKVKSNEYTRKNTSKLPCTDKAAEELTREIEEKSRMFTKDIQESD